MFYIFSYKNGRVELDLMLYCQYISERQQKQQKISSFLIFYFVLEWSHIVNIFHISGQNS